MKITLTILLVHLTILPNFCQDKLNLKSGASISKAFSENEIEGLEAMVRYVESMLIETKNEPNLDKAYHLLFEKASEINERGAVGEYVAPFVETEKYEFLKSLDSVQFAAVWRFDSHIDMLTVRDTTYRNLDNFPQLIIKPFSKYMDYLKEIGKEDAYFQKIQYHFESIGGYSAGDYGWFLRNHSKFDFTVPKYRLWAVINILRMEEPYEMKLDRYLKNN